MSTTSLPAVCLTHAFTFLDLQNVLDSPMIVSRDWRDSAIDCTKIFASASLAFLEKSLCENMDNDCREVFFSQYNQQRKEGPYFGRCINFSETQEVFKEIEKQVEAGLISLIDQNKLNSDQLDVLLESIKKLECDFTFENLVDFLMFEKEVKGQIENGLEPVSIGHIDVCFLDLCVLNHRVERVTHLLLHSKALSCAKKSSGLVHIAASLLRCFTDASSPLEWFNQVFERKEFLPVKDSICLNIALLLAMRGLIDDAREVLNKMDDPLPEWLNLEAAGESAAQILTLTLAQRIYV